jgi:hypothetical protein
MRTGPMLSQNCYFSAFMLKGRTRPAIDRATESHLHEPDNRNTQARKFRWRFWQFGVPGALINGVSLAGMKTASKGRKGSPGPCYNRRRINELGWSKEGEREVPK